MKHSNRDIILEQKLNMGDFSVLAWTGIVRLNLITIKDLYDLFSSNSTDLNKFGGKTTKEMQTFLEQRGLDLPTIKTTLSEHRKILNLYATMLN
jgi:hypothetical protein